MAWDAIFLWSPESSFPSLIPLLPPSSILDLLSSLFLKFSREKYNTERRSRRATDVFAQSFYLVAHTAGSLEPLPYPDPYGGRKNNSNTAPTYF